MGLPELKFLLQSSMNTLTMKRVITMLTPEFSPEGSNSIRYEKEVYGQFIKYLREVAGIIYNHRTTYNRVMVKKDQT